MLSLSGLGLLRLRTYKGRRFKIELVAFRFFIIRRNYIRSAILKPIEYNIC